MGILGGACDTRLTFYRRLIEYNNKTLLEAFEASAKIVVKSRIRCGTAYVSSLSARAN